MSLTKLELTKKLRALGIRVEGNLVSKKDIEIVLSENRKGMPSVLKTLIDEWEKTGRVAYYHAIKKTVSLNGGKAMPEKEATEYLQDWKKNLASASCVVGAARMLKRDIKLKDGRTFPKGSNVDVKFFGDKDNGHKVCEITVLGSTDMSNMVYKTAIYNLPKSVSGFTLPSMTTMRKWLDDGVAKTPTGKKTEPDGYAEDGSPSWLLALGYI